MPWIGNKDYFCTVAKSGEAVSWQFHHFLIGVKKVLAGCAVMGRGITIQWSVCGLGWIRCRRNIPTGHRLPIP